MLYGIRVGGFPAPEALIRDLLQAGYICLVTDHQGTPARPVPHGVPRGETAVRDAGLTAHHRLAGRPVSWGVTEPPAVSENILRIENILVRTSIVESPDLQTSLGGPTR